MLKYYGTYNMNTLPAYTRKAIVDMYNKVANGEPIVVAQQRQRNDFVWVTSLSVVDDFNGGQSWLIGTSDGEVFESHDVDLHVKDAYKNGETVTREALIGRNRPIFAF